MSEVQGKFRNVGELREFLKQFPDDMVVGVDGESWDYVSLDAAVDDRTGQIDQWMQDSPYLVRFWEGRPPDKVLVFS